MLLNKDFRRFALMGSAAVLALTIGAPAMAQDAAQDDAQTAQAPAGDNQDEEIVVTGFRASLENAVAEKKLSNQIVESISAEDIGKLPDASIAESIARLPGLTSQRLSGRSQVITIRGFAPDFSTTLLNGRQQVTTGDNRAVEFDQYPSEIMNQVLVYKTPTASLIGQGLSGTVDLRTVRPLSYGKQVLAVGGKVEYPDLGQLNAGSDKFGYRANVTYIDQFADRLGVALAASYVHSPYQLEEFNAWGYPTVEILNNNYGEVVNGVRVPRAGYAEEIGQAVIGGSKSYVTSTTLDRLGLMGTVEYEIDDHWTTTLDGYYSNFKDDQIKRGLEIPLYWSGAVLQPSTTISDGFITSGQFTNVKPVVRNDANRRKADIYSAGWNLAYRGDDGWKLTTDVSYSRVDRSELILETWAGTGRGPVGATDTFDFKMTPRGAVFSSTIDYSDPSLIVLTSPQGWGSDAILGGQDGYYNSRIVHDKLWQWRGEVEKDLTGIFSAVKVGMDYTDRTKSLTPDEYYLRLAANTNGTTSVPIPQGALLEPTSLEYLGLGSIVSYDPIALLNSGIYDLVRNPNADVLTKGWTVSEKVMTAYLQANIDTMIGASQLTGNIGVQMVSTDQHSDGFAARGKPIVQSEGVRYGDSYIDWLPSLNLSLRFPSDFVIRLGAARELARPRLDDMRASFNYDFNFALVGSPLSPYSGSGGNPFLRPWEANAVDLSFEKYFGRSGYLALQLFYKDLKTYIYNSDVPFDYSAFPLPPNIDRSQVNLSGFINLPQNGAGGELYGAELAGTLPFEVFSSVLSGFGVTGGVSYTETNIAPKPNDPPEDLPGYSKWVANGTAYFEKWGFNIRGSVRYRSTFVGELTGFGGNRQRRRATDETIVDAQIGYDFQPGSKLEGLSLYIQGQNLTDEPFTTTSPTNRLQVIDHQAYGRRFLAGFGYKF